MHISPDFAVPLQALQYPDTGDFVRSRLILRRSVPTPQYATNPPTKFAYGLEETPLPVTVEGGQELAYHRLLKQVQSYSTLPVGWDGYQGDLVKTRSQTDALLFLVVISKTFPTPRAMLSSDGEVSLYWENEKNYAEITFPGDGTYYYFCEAPDYYAEEDGLPSRPNPELPSALAEFLRDRFA